VSALGTSFVKGDPVVKLDSFRQTGEVFFLTQNDLRTLLKSRPGKYKTVKSWVQETLRREGCPACERRRKKVEKEKCQACGQEYP
jgi:hypothetical protein